jgi:hypothetical protein
MNTPSKQTGNYVNYQLMNQQAMNVKFLHSSMIKNNHHYSTSSKLLAETSGEELIENQMKYKNILLQN